MLLQALLCVSLAVSDLRKQGFQHARARLVAQVEATRYLMFPEMFPDLPKALKIKAGSLNHGGILTMISGTYLS